MSEPGGYYAKWNKADTERQTLYCLLYVEPKKDKFIEGEIRIVVTGACGGGGMGSCWSKDPNFLSLSE
jgi:hypothetical protein